MGITRGRDGSAWERDCIVQWGTETGLPPGGVYFAVLTRIGLWWYGMLSKSPIALWETQRGMISASDFSQDGEWIAIANSDGVIKVVDIQSGECLAQMKRTEEHNIYWHINFSPIVSGSPPRTLAVSLKC